MELISLTKQDGWWVAGLYNALGGYYENLRFLWYTKKDVICKLRHEYGLKVGRKFC